MGVAHERRTEDPERREFFDCEIRMPTQTRIQFQWKEKLKRKLRDRRPQVEAVPVIVLWKDEDFDERR